MRQFDFSPKSKSLDHFQDVIVVKRRKKELVDHHEIFKKLTFIFDVWIVVISLSQIFSFLSVFEKQWHLTFVSSKKKYILYVVVANKTEKEKQDSGQLKSSKNY